MPGVNQVAKHRIVKSGNRRFSLPKGNKKALYWRDKIKTSLKLLRKPNVSMSQVKTIIRNKLSPKELSKLYSKPIHKRQASGSRVDIGNLKTSKNFNIALRNIGQYFPSTSSMTMYSPAGSTEQDPSFGGEGGGSG